MRRLLLLLLVPLLSGVFVTVEKFEELEARVEYLESINVEEWLLTETFYTDGVHMDVTFVVVDGYAVSLTVCEFYDEECETEYYEPGFQEELYTVADRDSIIYELKSYIELLEDIYEQWN